MVRFDRNWKQSSAACSGVSKAAGVSHALATHKNAACLRCDFLCLDAFCQWSLLEILKTALNKKQKAKSSSHTCR